MALLRVPAVFVLAGVEVLVLAVKKDISSARYIFDTLFGYQKECKHFA